MPYAGNLVSMGSYENVCSPGENLLKSIWENIADVTGIKLHEPFKLRHLRIKSEPYMGFLINKFVFRTDESGLFVTPNTDTSDSIEIIEFVALNDTSVEIYYLF